MIIVGMSGYARSGKDEAAKVLVEEFGFTRISFADKLREFLYALNPQVAWTDVDAKLKFMPNVKNGVIRLRDVIDEFGWDGYKDTMYASEIRPLLQRLGTEAGREVLWDSIWIDAAFAGLDPDGKYVIADARFPNEAQAIVERGGQMWRISRAGNEPAKLPDGTIHSSETSLDDWRFDIGINNNETLERFQQTVRLMAEEEFA